MPPADLLDIKSDLDQIRLDIGGKDGVNVRLSLAEARLGSIEKSLDEHRTQSTTNHLALAAGLKDVADRAGGWRISIDPQSGRALGALIGAALAALAAGGGIGAAVTQAATSTPAAAQHAAPPPPVTPADAP